MTEPTPIDAPQGNTQPRVKRGFFRSHPWWCLGIYLLLVIASNIADWQADEARIVWGNQYMDRKGALTVEVDATGLAVNTNPLEYRVIVEGDPESALVPVVLLHGSPGAANGFDAMAPELTTGGRRVIYMDLPGFGSQNEPWSRGSIFEDYSSAAYARIIWRLLESMGDDERVHIVGWSNGGAVGLRMIEQHPDRIATLTLLASVGAQENEGTGSYAFEHFKYKVGRGLLVYGSHLIPHFGIMGPMGERNAFLRFFDDTDQRDLGGLMERIDTPTMIMHGRHDFLIPDRAAEDHYQRMRSARLVMMDAMHFIPFLHPKLAAEYLNPFFARHDTPGVEPETGSIDLAPLPNRTGSDRLLHSGGRAISQLPWWITLIACTLLIRFRPNLGIVLTMLFVAMLRIDFGVGLLAMILGRSWWLVRGAKPIDRPWLPIRWVRGFLFVLPAFVIGSIGGSWTLELADQYGLIGIIAGIWLTWLAIITLRLIVTREGRQRIKGASRRVVNHEYWPSGIIYLPVLWWGFKRVITGKGLRPLTAVNPGYSFDGGVQEERKSELNDRMGSDSSILHCQLIETDDDPDTRAQRAIELLEQHEPLGGLPVIAKPDRGERGRGVRLIRTHDDLRRYCHDYPEPFVLQRFHPGPIEVGIVWVREPSTINQPQEPAGAIYAINIKEFPELHGDGRHTLRQLILRHPRHRAQASMFLEALGAQQHQVPDNGERVSLGFAGNHAQGAMFRDGAHLITPALSERIDKIARVFRDERGLGFDIGRFDIRCASYEALQRGEDMGIVELNGLTSEPTNLYDPDRSITWAWGMLLGYWQHAAALSEARIAHGSGQPIPKAEMRKRMIDLIRVMLF